MTQIGRRSFVALLVLAAFSPVQAQTTHTTAPVRNQVVADDGHTLVVWSKSPAAPRGEIVFLHGRTWSALPNFDLHVSGANVSVMDALVARGYAVYALDQRGYGSTARDRSGWLTPNRAARDAEEVAEWVASRAPGKRKPFLLGYSRGSATAMLTAQRAAAKLAGVVLYAFYYDINNPPARVDEPSTPPRARTTAEAAAEDFITPESTPRGAKEAYVRSALKLDPVRVDWRHEEEYSALDPAQLKLPTLVINGEKDPIAGAAELPVFFAKIGTVDRWWVVLANADHVAHIERTSAFVHALVSFMERGAK